MNPLAVLSLAISLAALIKSTLERRTAGRFPILALVEERFPAAGLSLPDMLLASLAGILAVMLPFSLFLALGWARVTQINQISFPSLLFGLLTVLIIFLWAAMEELIYRGAVIPQAARLIRLIPALFLSAVLFAFGHLGGRGSQQPNLMSLAVYILDGIGFGVLFLATRNLWAPTLWHFSKNLSIWLLFSESTLQLTPGLLNVDYTGLAFWTGNPSQAGMADVLVTLGIVAAVTALEKNKLKEILNDAQRLQLDQHSPQPPAPPAERDER